MYINLCTEHEPVEVCGHAPTKIDLKHLFPPFLSARVIIRAPVQWRNSLGPINAKLYAMTPTPVVVMHTCSVTE